MLFSSMKDFEDPQLILTKIVREGFENNSKEIAMSKRKVEGLVMEIVMKSFMKRDVINYN